MANEAAQWWTQLSAIKRFISGAVGGAGALIAGCIEQAEEIAFQDLGCESVKRFTVKDLPLVVAIDSTGRNLFEEGRAQYYRA